MRRGLWFVCLLAACERNVKTEPNKTDPPPPPPSVAPASDGFGDWVRITPTDERLSCANYAKDEWDVYALNGTVAARIQTVREPNTGPDLPFAPPKNEAFRGRRHVLKVADGFLAGFDAGEWGGSLYWFSSDGKQQRELAKENVVGLVALDNDTVLAFEGLAHLSLDEGRARWLARDAAKGWRETSTVALDGAARAFTKSGDAIFVVTTKSLTRVDRDKRVTVVEKLPESFGMLYADSMTVDAKGRLFVGMRQLVLRFTPKTGNAFTLDWFAPKGCAEAEEHDLDCICTR